MSLHLCKKIVLLAHFVEYVVQFFFWISITKKYTGRNKIEIFFSYAREILGSQDVSKDQEDPPVPECGYGA